jgi:hypothetical protein
MTDEYKEKLEAGLEFQDYVAKKLIEVIGIPVTTYSSKKFQLKGENRQGFEIKFDRRYDETGNIYIETHEKSNAENPFYVDSGIYRDDNTWLYIIGDYNKLFIFGKRTLILMHDSKRYRQIITDTSKGFLVPNEKAETLCLKIINNEETQ